jgi:predicted Zn finger-like uncharacterized protein
VYTQCPDCATVFRVTAEALKAAQGDVRCGVCSTTFNALENLSEQAFKPGPEPEPPLPDDSMTVEELPGGENIELSAPAELSVVPDPPPPAADQSPPEDEALAMEFHGSDADLDRLFVVENTALEPFDPAEAATGPDPAAPVVDLDSTDEHPILVLDERDEPEVIVLETLPAEPVAPPAPLPAATRTLPEAPSPPQTPAVPKAAPSKAAAPKVAAPKVAEPKPAVPKPTAPPKAVPSGQTAPRILIPDEMRKRLAEEVRAREAAAAGDLFEPAESSGILAQHWPWVAGVAALALLLLLQVVHAERNDLVRSPGLGPLVAGAYSFLGLSVMAPTDLAAYELRQWGAASDPNASDRLMLRASIVNRAAYAQPFPLLRLTLQDRFGGTLGMRDIGPVDYLPGAGTEGLLEPGGRADALIRIVDPGIEAVGFELDICLPAPGGVRCANQVKTARQ